MVERGLVIDYIYPEGSDTRLDTPVVATITLELFTLDDRYGFLEIGRDSVSMALYILSGLLLIMATRTLRTASSPRGTVACSRASRGRWNRSIDSVNLGRNLIL